MTKARVNADNASADIQGVTAGTGLTGGGTSGTVTLTNDMATAIAAKGDLVAGTANDTYAALTVGANDTVLTADSTAATGLKWATPSSGSMTLINTGGTSMNGVTTVTISSIPSTYQNLYIFIDDFNGAAGGPLEMRPNNNTTTNYILQSFYYSANSSVSQTIRIDETKWPVATNVSANNSINAAAITINNYASTTTGKPIMSNAICTGQSTGNTNTSTTGGWFVATAISSLTFINGGGFNWTQGTIYVYGVK